MLAAIILMLVGIVMIFNSAKSKVGCGCLAVLITAFFVIAIIASIIL